MFKVRHSGKQDINSASPVVAGSNSWLQWIIVSGGQVIPIGIELVDTTTLPQKFFPFTAFVTLMVTGSYIINVVAGVVKSTKWANPLLPNNC